MTAAPAIRPHGGPDDPLPGFDVIAATVAAVDVGEGSTAGGVVRRSDRRWWLDRRVAAVGDVVFVVLATGCGCADRVGWADADGGGDDGRGVGDAVFGQMVV
jgi:hypothetical protein